MKYLLIRHAKTDANRLSRATFGKSGAPINLEGEAQVEFLKDRLALLGIDTNKESVAVSELLRTQQTAKGAGFKNLVINPLLNEVNTSDPQNTLKLVEQAKLPREASLAAKHILRDPPKEKVWVTHGLVIAALLVALGLSNKDHFIPDFCEIIEVEI